MHFETFTKYGLLKFDKFSDAAAHSIGEIIMQAGRPWYWYKKNSKWQIYLPQPKKEAL